MIKTNLEKKSISTDLTGEPNDLPLFHDIKRPLQRTTRVPLKRHKLPDQTRPTRTPPDRQPSSHLALNLFDFLVEFASGEAFDRSGRDGIHGGVLEETDGFVDVMREHGWRQREFGEGFRDSDDGFELSD